MGCFSNGTEGEDYQARYCSRCIHENAAKGIGCPIWNLHLMSNYAECNKPDSYLHFLIPRSANDLGNERCTMFLERGLLSNPAIEKIESEALARA